MARPCLGWATFLVSELQVGVSVVDWHVTGSICFGRCGGLGALGHMCLLSALGAYGERGVLTWGVFPEP